MSLKDAIQNLNAKIASTALSATAEELAYLASAAERIGGRMSVFELSDYADEKVAELDAALAAALEELARVASAGVALTPLLNSGTIDLAQLLPAANVGAISPAYQWLVQRTDGVAGGAAQFASIQGGPRSVASGGCMGTALPFQIDNNGAVVLGTPATMWTNPQGSQDFSTCSLVTDDKSGAFHYSGHIPWPGNTSHVMGYGYGVLNANNTLGGFWNSGTDNTKGIHERNGQYPGVPDADGSGWYGMNAGYASVDSLTRHHFCDFCSPTAPVITVHAPGANTGTSPIATLLLQADTTSANTALSGITHWRNSSSRVVARAYGFASGSFTDYDSGDDWGRYSSGMFSAVALSTGKTLVYHGSEAWLYSSHSSRVKVNAGPLLSLASYAPRMIPLEADAWMVPSVFPTQPGTFRFSKFSIHPTTFVWTYLGESATYAAPTRYATFVPTRTRPLPDDRLAAFVRRTSALLEYAVIARPTTWSFI